MLDFGESLMCFHSVGMLRDLLKNYSDDTTLYVCGTPGLFVPTEEAYISLEPLENQYDWYEEGYQDYLEF